MSEAHLIARTAAGLGNPLDLTVAEFDAHLEFAVNGGESDNTTWHERYVQESLR